MTTLPDPEPTDVGVLGFGTFAAFFPNPADLPAHTAKENMPPTTSRRSRLLAQQQALVARHEAGTYSDE